MIYNSYSLMFFRLVNMGQIIKFVVLFIVCRAASAGSDLFIINPVENKCPSFDKGGVDYILHVRGRDYGWKEHTHRANIALAVKGWRGTEDEMTKMELQLEEEIIKVLLKNSTLLTNENLAMFIHALIATRKNPWNFHGLNLVGDLLHRVENDSNVHPFIVLALCNSHAVEPAHLHRIKKYLEPNDPQMNPEDVANKAIALKAFACAATLPYNNSLLLDRDPFKRAKAKAVEFLVKKQERKNNQDQGKFGNVYTTSLVVQALTAYGATGWNEDKALNYLEKQSTINVNLLQAYYIELALNARKVKCIKDLYGGNISRPAPTIPYYYTTYSIIDEQDPDDYFTAYMKIPKGWNFFQVMERARDTSCNFNFSHVLDKNGDPSVYEVIGKPNDAEQNLFWTICRQYNVNHDPHNSEFETHKSSPAKIEVKEREHYFLWFRSSSCPLK